MTTPSAVVGQYLNGTYGLKTSLSPFNALTDDDNDPNKFSFNSNWTDLVRAHQVGVITLIPNQANSTFPVFYNPIPYPALPYVPFVQCKPIRDGILRDDWFIARSSIGGGITNYTHAGVPFMSRFQGQNILNIYGSDTNTKIIYVIYKAGI